MFDLIQHSLVLSFLDTRAGFFCSFKKEATSTDSASCCDVETSTPESWNQVNRGLKKSLGPHFSRVQQFLSISQTQLRLVFFFAASANEQRWPRSKMPREPSFASMENQVLIWILNSILAYTWFLVSFCWKATFGSSFKTFYWHTWLSLNSFFYFYLSYFFILYLWISTLCLFDA